MIVREQIQVTKIGASRISQLDPKNIQFGKQYSDHMFVADYADGKWSNLQIVPYGDLSLSPANATLHYGQTIFEGLKAYKNDQGEVFMFRPEANARRLNKSAIRMCMPEIPEDIFMAGLKELVTLDKDWVPSEPGTSLYVRPFMFAADPYVGIRPSDTYKFLIITCPVGSYYSEPVKVRIETKYTRAISGGIGFAKTAGNYAAALYPAVQAEKEGYHQLIWTDGKTHEYIEESGTMNVMFYIDDTLITAPTGDTILDGITRSSVLTLANDWGIKVEERPVSVQEVIQSIKENRLKDAFGTGTAATIAQIKAIAHEGTEYELPAIEARELSPRLLSTLAGIKLGQEEDKHNWVYRL